MIVGENVLAVNRTRNVCRDFADLSGFQLAGLSFAKWNGGDDHRRSERSHFLRLFVCILLLGAMFAANFAHADIPYMPFSIKIAQAYPVIEEGDPIMLNVTLKNNDPKRRLPVLIPGSQTAFEKIYYFKIYDAADNYRQLRWVESRQVQLTRRDSASPTLKYLAPGEQVVFSANLNDYPRYHQQIESHHALASPMFAGQYKVFLIYDPTGNPIGDTLYKYYDLLPADDCDDADRKLCFPSFGHPSEPFQLHIQKSGRGSFTFQGVV